MTEVPVSPVRPVRITFSPLPPIPTPDPENAEGASTEYSHYRTGLSHHRTELSEHRTDLSEFRTDLSSERTELSMRRTGMSIQRTRMSADRTLMSIIRTALSLIGFGFTVHEVFHKAVTAGMIDNSQSSRNFGLTLIVLGVLLLTGGIVRHVQFALQMRHQRHELMTQELVHGESSYPVSVALITAVLLWVVGLLAAARVVFNITFLG